MSRRAISEEELREIFPHPAVKDVAFEIRFAPRFRINEQLWQFQDSIVNKYDSFSRENSLQADGRIIPVHVFTNNEASTLIKVSESNFVFAATQYITYELFKAEALKCVEEFCGIFNVATCQRVGLRYINHIELPEARPFNVLEHYVNVPLKLDSIDIQTVTQLLSEFRMKYDTHQMTIRGALLQVPPPVSSYVYVLDLDCYAEMQNRIGLESVIDTFHHAIQLQFLQHVTENYKNVMRDKS